MDLLRGTVLLSAYHVGSALPSELSIVVTTAISFPTTTTDEFFREWIFPTDPITVRLHSCPRCDLILRIAEYFPRNNRFVIVLDKILWQLSSIGLIYLVEMVDTELLLHQKITLILFITYN